MGRQSGGSISARKLPRHNRAGRSRAIDELIRAGAERYQRERHLPWLARATPEEIRSSDPDVARQIVARLGRALRAERQRGRAGHWSYDLSRHIALAQALAAERRRLKRSKARVKETGGARHTNAAGEDHD